MGLQYDKLMELKQLRARITMPETPFEHLMVVSGNLSTKTVDAVWLTAGIDPFGFRLCNQWTDYPFTCVLVSGVLKGTATTHEWLEVEFNCRPQPHLLAIRRASKKLPPPELTVREIAVHHKDALHRAIDLVERNCDDFVIECIVREARMGVAANVGGRIVDAVARRIEMMFGRRLATPENRASFDGIMARHVANLDQAMIAEEVTSSIVIPSNLSWKRWFSFQTEILDDLRESIGLPGDIGMPEVEVELTRVRES